VVKLAYVKSKITSLTEMPSKRSGLVGVA